MNNSKKIILYILFFAAVFTLSYIYFSNKKNISGIWNIGDKMRFELDMVTKTFISSGAVGLNSLENRSLTNIKSNILIKIIEIGDTEVYAKGMIENFRQETNGQKIDIEFYNLPFLIKFHKNGQIIKITHSKLLNYDKKFLIEALIYNLQFTYYPQKKSWGAIEKTITDSYKTEYFFDEKQNILTRNILSYSQSDNEQLIPGSIPRINKGIGKIVLPKKKSWFESIEFEINLDLYKDKSKVFESETKFTAKYSSAPSKHSFWDSTDDKNKIFESLENPFKKTELSEDEKKVEEILDKEQYINPKVVDDALEQVKKQNIKFEVLMEAYISKYFGGSNNTQELKELFDILVGYLKKNPDECSKIIELIRMNKLPEKGSGFLFLLLEKTAHLKAQESLISILERSSEFSRLSLVRASGALMGIPHINSSLFDKLIFLEQSGSIAEVDGRNSALLTIGSLGNISVNPNIKTKSENHLRAKLLGVQNVNEISNAVILDAASNTGNPNLIPELEKFIFTSKHEIVKNHAVTALMHMPEKDANPVIIKILKSNDMSNIGSAVKVLNKRENFNRSKKIDPEINKILLDKFPYTQNSIELRKEMAEYLSISETNHPLLLKTADNKKENWEIRKIIYEKIPVGKERVIERVKPGSGLKRKR
ncbi:hypothetical protein KA977_05910 [Candidatus Dependentiae bacterium]|nr:hypothetical protein [Candidatus Dependentiae bacterium]